MAQINEVKIAGLEGNFQAQPRVFAHSATLLVIPVGATNSVDVLDISGSSTPGDTVAILSRGACLYVGGLGDVKVLLEGDTDPVIFKAVPAGSFLPIQALKVYGSGALGTTATDILALF